MDLLREIASQPCDGLKGVAWWRVGVSWDTGLVAHSTWPRGGTPLHLKGAT
jgi:hypothetical protein